MEKRLDAYTSGEFSSIAKAARHLMCLRGHFNIVGREACFVTYTENRKLQVWEEAALKVWILQRDDEEKPTLKFEVEEVAKSLVSERGLS